MARILVIEDNAVNLELTCFLLQAHGHEVLTATDGGAGLALARRQRPDLVLCDIQMPVLDGFAVASLMRAEPALARVPMLALTAAAMPGDRERALSSGFMAHVTKPIDPAAFIALVEDQLASGGGAAPMPSQEHSLGGAPLPRDCCAPRSGLVLLTVDDRAVLRELKQQLLEPAGYGVLACDCGESALDVLASRRVHAVLSDVVMPGIGGFELLRRLRAQPASRDLPFLFLTATARDESQRRQGLALGADAYLRSPIDPLALLREIHRVLARPGRR